MLMFKEKINYVFTREYNIYWNIGIQPFPLFLNELLENDVFETFIDNDNFENYL